MKVVRSPLTAAALGKASGNPSMLAPMDALVAVAGPDDFDSACMPPFMLHYLAEALARRG